MPNRYNIYRKNSPFTSRSVYYDTVGIPDYVTVRNEFVTNNLPAACDSLLFQGQPYELLNSLDCIETPTIFQFSSDDSSCSGYVSNISFAEFLIAFEFLAVPADITSIEIYGEIFLPTTSAILGINEFLDITYPSIDRAQSLVTAINNNVALNWRYTAFVDAVNPFVVRVVANFPGTQYNFQLPYFVVTTGGPVVYSVSDSADTSRGMRYQNYGYKMFLELWEITDSISGEPYEWLREGSLKTFFTGRLRLITTMEQSWNADNLFTFDVSKFLNIDKIIADYPQAVPTQFRSFTTQGREGIKCYLLKWGEMFTGGLNTATGNPLETNPWDIQNINYVKQYLDITEMRWASNGLYNLGILILFNDHPESWLSVDSNSTSLFNDYLTIDVAQDFIKSQKLPPERRYKLRRRTDEPEYLSILVNNDRAFSSDIDLRIFTEWTFVNGGTATSISHQTTNIGKNDIYEADVSLVNVDLANVELAAGLRVLHWNHIIQIRRDGITWTDLSTPVYYEMDKNDECDKYYKIWWTGNQGTTESFEFEGVFEMQLDYDAEYYTKSFNNNLYERNRHVTQAITKIPKRRFKLNTGWLTKDQFEWLESLLKTPYVWWKNTYRLNLYFGNGQLLPINYPAFEAINIINNSFQIDNVNKLFNLEIVIEYSVSENTSFS